MIFNIIEIFQSDERGRQIQEQLAGEMERQRHNPSVLADLRRVDQTSATTGYDASTQQSRTNRQVREVNVSLGMDLVGGLFCVYQSWILRIELRD